METHKKILEAIKSLASYAPMEVIIPFRGYDIVDMDAHDVRVYKTNNFNPLVIQWEEITPCEALRLKRACLYKMEQQLIESEERISELNKLKEEFRKTPFGC